ncbi:hypothetical protein [Flavobacterium sp.]|uniref:hypothetical protein n=1 Tax=Flavobacterium sp. TaxID=239 RepID=UPI00122003D2|nr:hypothetical protein [Flavobacterium sp.]RZJ70021.1 MAG: hypothetical protein EOO49_15315 [Flavobacterium sp.]
MKKLFTVFALLIALTFQAQTSDDAHQTLNNYKFVIVPSKFSFLKEPDQFQLNMFTKMYFEKYGFKVFYDTDLLPPEAAGDNCNKLFADVIAETNMFVTKLTVVLRDCVNKEVYRSDKGASRDKDYKISYRQALREAFKSFDTLVYEYNGKDGIRGELGGAALPASKLKTAPNPQKDDVIVDKNTLFAQPIENGFQLVNSEPKVIYKLKKTSSDQVFLAEKDGQTGTFIAKGKGKWVFEYYVNGQLKTDEVSVKF